MLILSQIRQLQHRDYQIQKLKAKLQQSESESIQHQRMMEQFILDNNSSE